MDDRDTEKKSGLLHILKNDFSGFEEYGSVAPALGFGEGKKKIIVLLKCDVLAEKKETEEKHRHFEHLWYQSLKKQPLPENDVAVTLFMNNHFVILTDYSVLDMVIEALCEAADLFAERYQIGIGNPFDKPEYLSISYREAHEAILHSEPGQIINSFNTEKNEDADDLIALEEFNKNVISALENGLFSAVPGYVNDFFANLRHFEPDYAFNLCLSSIDTVLEYFGISKYTQFKIKYRFDLLGISNEEILGAIKATYTDNMVRIVEFIKNMKGNPAEYMIKKVQEMVLSGYSKQDLSLFDISKKLHISYGYLSKLIKQKMGVSFVSYLTSVRMSNAKKMLFDGGLKVYEIAKATGFNSSGYFITAFRKYYGLSPSDFREGLSSQVKEKE